MFARLEGCGAMPVFQCYDALELPWNAAARAKYSSFLDFLNMGKFAFVFHENNPKTVHKHKK
jgi:hypothetical protein